jgi:hypothetical protein
MSPGTLNKGCTNLAIMRSEAFRTIHVGSKAQGEGDIWEFLKDDTKKLADATVMRKLADLVEAALSGDLFERLVALHTDAKQDALPAANVEPTIDEVAAKFTFTQDERNMVMARLIQGGELTRHGLAQAITRTSADIDDYDRATDLERAGGQIIELGRDDWKKLAA